MTFQDLPLKESLLKAIADRGYNEPTEIQAQAIPVLANQAIDFVGQAQTGTGKTAAFAIPIIDAIARMKHKSKAPSCIVMAPTRELAEQIKEAFNLIGKQTNVKTISIVGGVTQDAQITALKK